MVKSEIIKVIKTTRKLMKIHLIYNLPEQAAKMESVVPALVANIPIKGMKNAGR